jgi:hypothetical protein
MRLLTIAIILMTAHASSILAAEPTTGPAVVVELFTSEGCSSCPPADALLAKLAKPDAMNDVELIPLALHVDYWNDLGWTDPYSSPEFTQRQRDYATALHARQIYTPQMIVDGANAFVGSDANKAKGAIRSASKLGKGIIDLRVSPVQDGLHISIAITNLPADRTDSADVQIAVTEDDLESNVARGENAGRKLKHLGVVRVMKSIGVVARSDTTFTGEYDLKLDSAWHREQLKVVTFVQQAHLGPILAAKSIRLSR